MDAEPSQLAAVRDEILRYLEAHPHAADTSEGVYRWWLVATRHAVSQEAVTAVLDALALEGRLTRTTIVGGRVVYGARTDE